MPDVFGSSIGKTLSELMLLVAIDVGLARLVDDNGEDAEPELPAEKSKLALLRRAVNDGYEAFLRFRDWTFLTPEIAIDFDPSKTEPWRYTLPDGVASGPAQPWVVDTGGAYATGTVKDVPAWQVIGDLRRVGATASCPTFAACRPIAAPSDTSASPLWELVVSPAPCVAGTMRAPFRLHPRELTAETQRPVSGAVHDRAVRLLAVREFRRPDGGAAFDAAAAAADIELAASASIDQALRPKSVSPMRETVGASGDARERFPRGPFSYEPWIPAE